MTKTSPRGREVTGVHTGYLELTERAATLELRAEEIEWQHAEQVDGEPGGGERGGSRDDSAGSVACQEDCSAGHHHLPRRVTTAAAVQGRERDGRRELAHQPCR